MTLSYCQRLVQRLDRIDAARTALREQPPSSRLLELPREIRQHILYNTLDDREISWSLGNQQSRRLSAVCSALKADMTWVCERWRERKEELLAEQEIQRGAFDTYMKDLMEPVLSMSAAVRPRRPYNAGRKRRNEKRNEQRRLSDKHAASLRADQRYHSGFEEVEGRAHPWHEKAWIPRSQAEAEEVSKWRLQRESRKAKETTNKTVKQAYAKMREAYSNSNTREYG